MTAPQDIRANGISIRYRVEGREGAPWLVFSNSLMTNHSLWDDQVAALADRFRILRYDQRGHGHTGVDARPCNMDLLADDVTALLDALKITRMTFIGISMGSTTALRMAQRYPERIERIIMCAGSTASAPSNAPLWQERIEFARANGMAAMAEPTVGRWFHPDSLKADAESVKRVREMIRTTPFEGFVACATALKEFDLQAGLPQLRLPVLLIAGEGDASATKSLSALQQRIAGAKYFMVPKAGHLSNIEAPAPFNARIADFLDNGL